MSESLYVNKTFIASNAFHYRLWRVTAVANPLGPSNLNEMKCRIKREPQNTPHEEVTVSDQI
jgi:hypothetical protein